MENEITRKLLLENEHYKMLGRHLGHVICLLATAEFVSINETSNASLVELAPPGATVGVADSDGAAI